MSCSSETLRMFSPDVVPITLRSARTPRPIAVDDIARPSAATTARRQSTPNASAREREQQRRAEQLHAAPAEDGLPQRPEALRLELEADQEEHQHDAELGDLQHVLGPRDELQPPRADQDAGAEVADDRTEAEEARQGNGEDRGGEIDEAAGQPVGVPPSGGLHRRDRSAARSAALRTRRIPRGRRARASPDSRRAAVRTCRACAASSASLARARRAARAAAGSACRTAPRSARRAAGRRRRSSGCSCRAGTSPRGRRCSPPARGPCRAAPCRPDRRPSRTRARRRARASGAAACCTSGSAAARRRVAPRPAPPARRRCRSGSRDRARRGRAQRRGPAALVACSARAASSRRRFARECSSSGWATMTRISARGGACWHRRSRDAVRWWPWAGQVGVARAPGAANIPAKREGGPACR